MKLKDYPKFSKKHDYGEIYCEKFEKALSQFEQLSPELYLIVEKAMNENFNAFESGFEMNELTRMMIKNRSEQDETMEALQSVTFELENLQYDFQSNDTENIHKLLSLYLDHKKKMALEKEAHQGIGTSLAFRQEVQIVNYLAHLITERTLSINGLDKNTL